MAATSFTGVVGKGGQSGEGSSNSSMGKKTRAYLVCVCMCEEKEVGSGMESSSSR